MRPFLFIGLFCLATCQPQSNENPSDNLDDLAGKDGGVLRPRDMPNKNGGRLKIAGAHYRGGDGLDAVIGEGIYDIQFKTYCFAQTTEDGKTRCIPLSFPAANTQYFSDSSCQSPIFAFDPTCTMQPQYVTTTQLGGNPQCFASYRYLIWETNVNIDPKTLFFKENSASPCMAITAMQADSFKNYKVINMKRKLDPGEFIEISQEIVIR